MKLILSFLLLFTFVVNAQNNLVVFTQESKPFYVIVNGIRQNQDAETNVKIENLPGDFYRVKVVFADGKTPDVDKSVSFMEKNQEYSLEVKEKRGKYKMRFAGMRPISQSTNTGTSIAYHEEEVEEVEQSTQPTETTTQVQTEGQTQTSSSSQGTQTTVSSSSSIQSGSVNSSVETNTSQDGSVSVNVDMNENGVSMNVNVPEGEMDDNMNTEVSTGTNSTNSQSSSNVSYSFISTGSMCSSPDVSNKDFIDFKYTLENANMFKRQDLILAYFKSHCMLSEQVAGLIKIDYSTVEAKKIAKEGYRYTYDTENYGVVIDALKNNSDKEEVVTFIGAGTTSSSTSTSQSSSTNGGNVQINSSTTTTVNSSVSSSSSSSNSNNTSSENTASSSQTQYSQIPSYSGYINCNTTLISDISDIYNSASNEAFADDQRKVIELATREHCLSVEQVAKLAGIFSHESDQLDFMKWAFDKTYDIDNFYKLASELTYSSSKDELDEFIDEQPTSHFTYVYSTNSNDGMLIDDADLKQRMEEESFADDKLKLAKQALVSRYISTSQVKSIMSVFSHESDVLEFLKMAYPRTTDKDQFYKLRGELTFSSSKEEFDKIVE